MTRRPFRPERLEGPNGKTGLHAVLEATNPAGFLIISDCWELITIRNSHCCWFIPSEKPLLTITINQ
jgi:hypothetical protein